MRFLFSGISSYLKKKILSENKCLNKNCLGIITIRNGKWSVILSAKNKKEKKMKKL